MDSVFTNPIMRLKKKKKEQEIQDKTDFVLAIMEDLIWAARLFPSTSSPRHIKTLRYILLL